MTDITLDRSDALTQYDAQERITVRFWELPFAVVSYMTMAGIVQTNLSVDLTSADVEKLEEIVKAAKQKLGAKGD